MAMAHALWQIYVIYGLVAALGFAATSPVNTTALVNGWFEKKRGLALSLATSGSAYGQLLIVPIATVIVIHWGWRAAYYSVSAAMFLLVLPLVVCFVRDSPTHTARRLARRANGETEERVSIKQALRTLSYWQLSFGMFTCGFTMSFASVHMIPYLTDMPEHSEHMMQTTASLALSVVGGCSIVGAIVLGLLADRKGRREILALTYFLRGMAFLLLLLVGSWIPGIFMAAVVLGISWTSTTPLGAAIAADIYGRASIGTIFGFIYTAMNLGSATGAWLAGLDRDNFGNYHASLIANVIMGVTAAAITMSIRMQPFEARQRERRPAARATTVAGD
jgi:predicted MFS family arabinose efflux permease